MIGARLLVVQGVDQGRRFEISQPTVQIGRGVQNDIRIFDTEVSRRHATLSLREAAWHIDDAGSSNGTFVNGRPVGDEPLRPGDQIQIGRTILLFTEPHAEEASVVFDQVDLTAGPDDASQIIDSVIYDNSRALDRHTATGVREWTPSEANLDVLYRISEEVVRPSVSLDQLLKRILDLTLEAVQADRGVMFVADSRTDQIDPRVVSVREGMSVSDRVPVSRTIVEYVILNGEGVQTTDAIHDERFGEGHSIAKAGIREAMCVPIRGRYELLGVIYVDITTPSFDRRALGGGHRFSKEQLTLLAAIGRQSALAVENNRFQEALVAAERLAAVGQAIAILGHDIKNILQGMKGGSYLIDQGLQQTDETMVRKGWGIVERNQDRIFNLVMDMLSFSKDRPPKLRVSDVNETVRDVCELIQPGAEEQGTEVVFEPDPSLPAALFDPDAIHRAVLNLATNALSAVDGTEGAKITFSTRYDPKEGNVTVSVRDNGPGISPEDLPHLFSLFHSGKGSRGTGLGLPVSQKILREHGGDIRTESRPGEGAVFHMTWPLHEEDAEGSSISRVAVKG